MTFDPEALARKNILNMEKYASAREDFSGKASVFLDANENALGSMAGTALNRYPDPLQKKLRQAIAKDRQIRRPEKIFLGNGSDEAIDLLMRVFCEPRLDKILLLPPTYGMYRVCASINDIGVLEVPLTDNFMPDTPRILERAAAEKPKLIFLCSPNNPSGNLMSADAVESILRNSNAVVVLDEAYIDFSPGSSWIRRLEEFPNLVILQTFSKAWGMAAARMGMAFADESIIHLLNKIKYPYNISDVIAATVLDALQKRKEKEKMVALIIQERQRLMQEIARLSSVLEVLPSDANFFMVRFDVADRVYTYLKNQGIIVRNRSALLKCRGCLRITVGNPEENQSLLSALQEYEKEKK
jgi:histidinol-phosphate aminotransferase